MSRWFRHYAGMSRDDKLVRAAVKARQPVERAVWVYGAILESAAEINDAGRFDFDVDEAAYFLRCEPSDLAAIVDALCDLGRIDAGKVTKWGDRQFESDGSKERQQRYRDRLKASRDVTPPSPDGQVTPQEAETETQSETDNTPPSVPEAVHGRVDFFDVYDAFPQNPSSSESKAQAAWHRIKPEERQAVLDAAIRYAKWFGQDCEARGRTIEAGLSFVPHMAKWLDGGHWREAAKLPIKGEVDPETAARIAAQVKVHRDDPIFTEAGRMRGKQYPTDSNGYWHLPAEIVEQARANLAKPEVTH